MKAQLESILDAEDLATVKQLAKSRVIKCLMDKWLKSRDGKAALRDMNKVTGSLDVLSDIKAYIKNEDAEKLEEIRRAIDNLSSVPGGQGFVDLISGYMDANMLINNKLSADDLTLIQEKVASGDTYGLGESSQLWLTHITSDLLRG